MRESRIFLASLLLVSLTGLPACSGIAATDEASDFEQNAEEVIEQSDVEQSQSSDETDHGMATEVAREPEPRTMQYEDEMWRESVCANFPDGYIEDSEALRIDKYLSEEDYLNSFKWCKTDRVVDVTDGGIVNNDFIKQDMVDAVVEYAHYAHGSRSASEVAEAFQYWFENQPFGADYALKSEGQAPGPAVMRRNNVIYIASKHGRYDDTYGVVTSDCDVLVYDLNTNRVLSCERQIEHETGTVSDGHKTTLLPAE